MGSLELVLGNDDVVSARPPFGWTPTAQPSVWFPAGRPDDWPIPITVAAVRLPGGIGLGFDRANRLLIADKTACRVVDPAAGGRELRRFPFRRDRSGEAIRTVVVSPDGERVFVNSWFEWAVYDARRGELLTRKWMPPREAFGGRGQVAFSPDGRDLFAGGSHLGRYAGDGSALSAEVAGPADQVCVAAKVVVSADDKVGTVRDRGTLAVQRSFPIRHDRTDHAGLKLSADDRWLASSDQDGVGLYDVATGRQMFYRQPNRMWQGDDETGGALAFLPGSRWLVAAGADDGRFHLIDVPNGRSLFEVACDWPTRPCCGVAVSPDGQWLALLSPDHTALVSIPQLLAAAGAVTTPGPGRPR